MKSSYDGTLRFDTSVDKDGFESAVRELLSSLDGIGKKIKKIGTLIGVSFGAKYIIDLGKKAIDTASDLQEVQNVVEVAFGSMSDKIDALSKKAIEQLGMSELTYKRTASTFMAMSKGMGIAEDEAAGLSVKMTNLVGDMASFYNVSQDVAATALQSIWTGETETLKRFGVVMTEANLQQYAYEQGIRAKVSALSQEQEVMLRAMYVTDQLALAQGDFARTSGSWANQTRILSERWSQFLGIMGNGLIQVLTPVVRFINAVMAKLISFANLVSSIFGALFGGKKATDGLAKSQTSVASAGTKAAKSQNKLAGATKKAAKEAKNATAAFDEMIIAQKESTEAGGSGGGAGDEFQIAGGGFGGLTDVEVGEGATLSPDLLKVIDRIREAFTGVWDYFKTEVFPTISSIFNGAMEVISAIIDSAKAALLTLYNDVVVPVAGFIAKVFKGAWDGIKTTWETYGRPIVDAMVDAWNGFATIISSLWTSTIKPVWDKFMEVLDAIWTNHLKPLWDNINNFVAELILFALQIWNEVISPIVNWLVQTLGPVVATILNGILSDVGSVIGTITDIINGIVTVLRGIITFISGVFSGDWKKAWEGISSIFSVVWNGLKKVAETAINAVIWVINQFIKAYNTTIGRVGGWLGLNIRIGEIPEVNLTGGERGRGTGAGRPFKDGTDWIPYDGMHAILHRGEAVLTAQENMAFQALGGISGLSAIAKGVPRLASGAVIPANKEFLGVLGDQKNGNNLEAPEDLIRKIVREESNNIPQIIEVNIGGKKLARIVTDEINAQTRRDGRLAIDLV